MKRLAPEFFQTIEWALLLGLLLYVSNIIDNVFYTAFLKGTALLGYGLMGAHYLPLLNELAHAITADWKKPHARNGILVVGALIYTLTYIVGIEITKEIARLSVGSEQQDQDQ